MGLLDSIFVTLGLRKDAPSSADEPLSGADDPERDMDLEKQDDHGTFDFEADVGRFFTAEFRIDTLWDKPERRDLLFVEYEIRDVAHWYQIKATFRRWVQTPAGKAKYPTSKELMQARMSTTQAVNLDDLKLPP